MIESHIQREDWRMYLKTSSNLLNSNSTKYPEWIPNSGLNRTGPTNLIIWNETEHKSAVLTAIESVNLLHKLQISNDWQISGLAITRKALEFQVLICRKKKNRKKDNTDMSSADEEKSQWVEVLLLRLPPQASLTLLELLQNNQGELSALAEQERKMRDEAISRFYKLLSETSRKVEEDEINFPSRSIAWSRLKKPSHWICVFGENRGAVYPNYLENWSATIEINKKHRGYRSDFTKLIDAVNWVENEIQHPNVDQSHLEGIDQECIRQENLVKLHEKVNNYPLLIKPENLDSVKISYQIVIDVESTPVDKKTYETEFGDVIVLNEEYLSPAKLAALIGLDPDLYTIEQPQSKYYGWCRFIGLTFYNLENLAISKAQNAWDQSKIATLFKSGKVTKARYGYIEEETEYTVFIGECSNNSSRWEEDESRQKFLENKAFRLSILHSLEVSDLRCFFDLSPDTISDKQLLILMHKTRSYSAFLSKEEKLRSQLWLLENASDQEK